MDSETRGRETDEAIIKRVLKGERDLFNELITRHRDQVFRIVGTHLPRNQVAEIAHEVFVELFKSLAGFSPEQPFAHWLARIAVRCCHDYWRRTYRRVEIPLSQIKDGKEELERVVSTADPDQRFENREFLDQVLSRLNPDDRMVLGLVYFEGLRMKEAARLLGWSESKVKVRTHRAREQLRAILKDQTSKERRCHGC